MYTTANRYSRLIPLAVLLLVLAALITSFGPRVYRSMLLSRDCSAMLGFAAQGKTSAMANFIDPAQQAEILALLQEFLPPGYEQNVRSLKLYGVTTDKDGSAWTLVICNTGGEGSAGSYQGNLHWVYEGGRWIWDFKGSEAAQFSISGDTRWDSLDSYVRLASQWR